MDINPPQNRQQHDFTHQEISLRADAISKSDKATGSDDGNWYAAIKELQQERFKLRQICTFLWSIITSPYWLMRKLCTLFANPNDRAFYLDVIKTFISVSSLIAAIVAGGTLYCTFTAAI